MLMPVTADEIIAATARAGGFFLSQIRTHLIHVPYI
jgi:hypothetical protein